MSEDKTREAPPQPHPRITLQEMIERLRSLPAPPSIEKRDVEEPRD